MDEDLTNAWSCIKQRIAELAAIDSQCVAFGADAHQYRFARPASAAELGRAERKLGVALPRELAFIYTQMGNGGAGPFYGLLPLAKIYGMRRATPFVGAAALRERFADAEMPDGYFEAPEEEISGLVDIIPEGCGHMVCVLTAGVGVGRIVNVSADGFVCDGPPSVATLYEGWLKKELATFAAVREAMDGDDEYDEIAKTLGEMYKQWDTGDRIASIAGVERPVELFGSPVGRHYHGAVQNPWYERVLADYRRKRKR